jgi:hypothetical protein
MERKFQILYPFHFQISKVVSFHLTHLTPKHYIMRQKRERERENCLLIKSVDQIMNILGKR